MSTWSFQPTRTSETADVPSKAMRMLARLSGEKGACSVSTSTQSRPDPAITSVTAGSVSVTQAPGARSPAASFWRSAMPFSSRDTAAYQV